MRAGADLDVKGCAGGTVLGWCGNVVIFIVAGRACSGGRENDGSRLQHWKWYNTANGLSMFVFAGQHYCIAITLSARGCAVESIFFQLVGRR